MLSGPFPERQVLEGAGERVQGDPLGRRSISHDMLRYAMSYMLVVSHVHSSYILSLNGSPVGLSPPANICIYIYRLSIYTLYLYIYILMYV